MGSIKLPVENNINPNRTGQVRTYLLLLSAVGVWSLWVFPAKNGLLEQLESLGLTGALIPGHDHALMRHNYTGAGFLDRQLTILVGFFYTAIDDQRRDITLTFFNLESQVLAAWMLIVTESQRHGNKDSIILRSVTCLGVAIALVGYACVAPLFFAAHLLWSKGVSNPKSFNLIVDQPIKLAIAPIAAVIGFGIPSAITALPAPSVLTYDQKQRWVATRQGWPLWIFLAQSILETIFFVGNSMLCIRTEKQKRKETNKYMRRAYIFALVASASAHMLFVGAGAVATFLPDGLSLQLQDQLDPENLIVPPNPFSELKAETLADGALWFLQWDLIVGVVATMIWAITLKLAAEEKENSFMAWAPALIKYSAIATVAGPSGAAVWAIWDRDEAVFRSEYD